MASVAVILADGLREFSIPRGWRNVTWVLAATGAAALLTKDDHSLMWPLLGMVLPVFVLPIAAHATARDVASGFYAVLITSGLRPSQYYVGRLLNAGATALFVSAGTSLLLALALAGAGESPIEANVARFSWLILLSLVAAATGVVVGAVARGSVAKALVWSFVIVFVWIELPTFSTDILTQTSSETIRSILLGILHLSPLMWAMDEFGSTVHRVFLSPGAPPAFLGPLLMGAVTVIAGWVCTRYLYHHTDPVIPRRASVIFIGLAAVAVGFIALFATWGFTQEDPDRIATWSSEGGDVSVTLQSLWAPDAPASRWESGPLRLSLGIRGEPGAQLLVSGVKLESRMAEFTPIGPAEQMITLNAEGPDPGTGSAVRDFTAKLSYAGGWIPIEIRFAVDGEPGTLRVDAPTQAPTSSVASVLAGAVLLAAGAWLAQVWVPRRLRQ